MSKSNNAERLTQSGMTMPTAPLPPYNVGERPPPPSYEESQMAQYQQTARQAPPHYYHAMHQTNSMTAYYNAQYQPMHQQQYQPIMMQQQQYQPVASVAHVGVSTPHVLSLAKGAEVRYTASGQVSIPPPPPGCAPTAAQLAAMQGQPVVLQRKKRSFF